MAPSILTPIAFRVARRWRRARASTVAIAAIVAIELAAVLLVAAGAARTAEAPDTWVRRNDPGDVVQITQYEGPAATREIAALPSVSDVRAITFMMAGVDPGGDEAFAFAGEPLSPIVDGRAAERPDEFVANSTFVEGRGFTLGQQFTFVSLTSAQGDAFGFDVGDPQGPTFTATLVGMIRQTADGDPTRPGDQILIFPESVLGAGDIATRSSVLQAELANGRSADDLRREVAALDDSANFIVTDPDPVSAPVRTSVRTMANALWILSAVAAVAAISSLGQFVTRRVQLSEDERGSLLAIGLTRRQIAAESVVVAALPVGVGLIVAILVAVMGSGRFPFGFARPLDPGGVHVDVAVLLGGGVAAAFVVLVWVTVAVSSSSARRPVVANTSLERSTAALSAPAATGVRFAFGRSPAATGSTRAAFAGIALVTAGVVGALTVGSSMDRLNDDERRFGRVFDVMPGDAGQTEIPADAARYLQDDPGVTTLSELAYDQAQVAGRTIELVAWHRLRGEETVYAVDGRIPSADDEIMLGRRTARSLGVGIGDDLTLTVGDSTVTYRVTGLAPILGFGGNEGVGSGGMLTLDALQRLDPAVTPAGLGVSAPRDVIQRITNELSLEAAGVGNVPSSVVNLRRIDAVPSLLAALLVLAGAVTLGHSMLMAVRHRRRDLAILRALGAHQRWTTSVVHTQATVFSMAALLLGVPLGLLTGRLVFLALANSIGVDNRPSLPLLSIAVTTAAFVALANLVTIGAARRARRVEVVRALSGE